jgi:CMP/dCMP kinase
LNATSFPPSLIVTIDGPSGSGKGTLSQMLAKKLGFHLLDSGALYRLVALAAMKQQVDLTDQSAVARVAANLDVYFDTDSERTRVLLANEDVTEAIRLEQVGMNASVVAAYPPVRSALLTRQQDFAKAPGLVADGRDMGTMVFPAAPVKIFLTASAEARAERRCMQLQASGQEVDIDVLIKDIRERDERDTNRIVSPLKPAADAVCIDSTALSITEVFDQIMRHVRLQH